MTLLEAIASDPLGSLLIEDAVTLILVGVAFLCMKLMRKA